MPETWDGKAEGFLADWKTTRPKKPGSPLWQAAVERYRAELEDNEDYDDITEVASLDDLLDHARNMESLLPPEKTVLTSMNRLGPRLKFVDDFSAIVALYLGADPKATGLVWGSIRMMLNLASSAGDTLQDVLDMLEELSLTLPRLGSYEKSLPLSRALEAAIIDVYTEVICFYARTISFFRTHPHVLMRRNSWDDFRSDFDRTIRRIKRLSTTVESEAEMARMQLDQSKYKEVLELIESTRIGDHQEKMPTKFHQIPVDPSPRFWGREEALQSIKEAFHPRAGRSTLETFALHGMGGSGKTQTALQYAHQSRDLYTTILWVAAESTIGISQSFRSIACGLGLVEKDEEAQDAVAAILKVKNWLSEESSPWLIIFDNADQLDILQSVWPRTGNGSLLITTRDFNAVHGLTATGYNVKPFDEATGANALLKLLGLEADKQAQYDTAIEISRALGGLPLAIGQIAGFIAQRKLPLGDFLPLYERNAAKIDARKSKLSNYEHSVSTVWEMSIRTLSIASYKLLVLLSFLEPDAVHETVLLEGSKTLDDSDFEFLGDEMDLGDVEEPLLQTALIDKNADEPVLSVHRLVQAAVIRRLSKADQSKYVDLVVRILSWGFPDTWSQDVGHQFQFWKRCEKCLPHVNNLVNQVTRHSIAPEDPQAYGELLLRCSWYLYEREQYVIASKMINEALNAFKDQTTLAFASATDLSGLIELDLCKAEEALVPFKKAMQIRKDRLGSEDALMASSLNNLALSYTEMEDLEQAYAAHQKAMDIRLRTQSDRIGNTYSNMASLLLRMGKPDEAEEMLKRCPSLKDFTDDTFLKTGNPRFSGDMVLLSRIRRRQGKADDALRLASKALAFRQNMLGNRLKTCDSLFDVASLLHEQANVGSALELLERLIAIAETLSEGSGQLARALYKMTMIYQERGQESTSDSCRARAMEVRKKLIQTGGDGCLEEKDFMKLCPWMLW